MTERPGRYFYNAASLRAGMRDFEEQYEMSSREFYERHVAGDPELHVPRFERHVWASFYEDVQRLEGSRSIMDRVSESFAVPA